MHRTSKLALAAATVVVALAACQTTPPVNSDLTLAQAAVQRAGSNPYVARSAAIELERAQQALAKAQTAWAADRDGNETRHLAYLASQRAEIALAIGERAQADERVEQAGTERERVRLQARTREADAATRAAQEAQATARAAQSAARTAQGNAMQSREEAEAARLQAEAARSQAEAARAQADAARVQATQQASRADNLERDLQELRGRKTDRGMVVTLGDVLFDTGSANLNGGAQRSIDQLIQVLRQYPDRKVRIEGFTDSVGSDTMNMQLSQRRAEAFARALTSGGIAANRIDVRAWGEASPVADNGTAAGRQQNRRVEVVFSDPLGRFASL